MRGKNTAATLAVAVTTLFLVASVVPGAQAQTSCTQPTMCPNKSTPTTLYFHIFDVFNNFPINTQMPNTTYFEVGGTNFPTVVEENSQTNYDFNTIYGYSTSGPVEYGFIENGQPRFHPERGIASDVKIDGAAPATVYLYVSVRDVVGSDLVPNFMPTYTFEVEMKEKNVLGDNAELDSGALIMSGSLTYSLASKDFAALNGTADPNGVIIRTPNEDGIVEYAIPMVIESGARIPKTEGYHMKISWYQDASPDGSQKDRTAEGYMRLASEEGYHPRLEMSIFNPVYIDFIHPQAAAGIALIHTAENSPWGTYDIDVDNITVAVTDSAGNPMNAKLQQVVSQNAHVHNLHDKSAEVTYLWRYRDEGIPDGEYTITVSVQNMAHTATATGTAAFVLEGKKAYGKDEGGVIVESPPDINAEEESSPGAGLMVLVTSLGAAVVMRRRNF